MASAHDPISADDVAQHLTTRWLGRPCYAYGTLTSTMDVARRLAEGGAPVGTLIVADAQTAGRGRQRKQWSSSRGIGLYCSLILPAMMAPAKMAHDTMTHGALVHVLACGVAEALEQHGVAHVAVKWPNDVMVAHSDEELELAPRTWPDEVAWSARKIAGILVEKPASANTLIAGIGINVAHRADDFPSEVAHTATSIALSTGRDVPRVRVLADVLHALERRVDTWRRDARRVDAPSRADGGVHEWTRRSLVLGRRVRVTRGTEEFVGRATEICEDGALVVSTEDGLRTMRSGTIRFVQQA